MIGKLKISAKERAIEEIKTSLLKGHFSDGEKLPAERELAEMIGVSRTALRAAITELVSSGVLLSVHGSGNYVRPKKIIQVLQAGDSFTRMAKADQLSPSSKLRHAEITKADEKIAGKLGVSAGDEIFVLSRLRLADDLPVAIETVYVSTQICPGIERFDFETNSFYDILEHEYGLIAKRGSEDLSVSTASEDEAKDLQVEPGYPVIFERASEYDANNVCVEYVESVILHERYRFVSLPRYKKINSITRRWVEF